MHGRVYLKQQSTKQGSTEQESAGNSVVSIELEMTPVGPTWPSRPRPVSPHISGSDNLGVASSDHTSAMASGHNIGSIPEVRASRGLVDLDNVLRAPAPVAESAFADPPEKGPLAGEFWAPLGIGLMPLKV